MVVTDFKLLVQGLQGVTERVGLNNSGLLLEVRLVMELSGAGGDWFWGSYGLGSLGQVRGRGYSLQIFTVLTGHARHY